MSEYKYFAFISYSHRDERFATKIHRELERIKIPLDLVAGLPQGLQSSSRMRPIFRDKDELPSTSSLPDTLQENLRASAYLIVICSPDSAMSRWVNEEIRYFQSLGRSQRILCIIVRGSPTAYSETNEGGALSPLLGADDRPLPLAADITGPNANISREIMRLGAGMLRAGFDILYKREARRRRTLFMTSVALAAASIGVIGFLGLKVLTSEGSISEQRNQASINQSVVLAQQSDIAARERDFEKAVVLALEGMPDRKSGVEKPLEPKVQAALSRSYWNLTEGTSSSHDSALFARVTDRGLLSLVMESESEYELQDERGQAIAKIPGDGAYAMLGDISSTGNVFVTVDVNGAVNVRRITGEIVSTFNPGSDYPTSLRINNAGNLILTAYNTGKVTLWTVEGEQVVSMNINGGVADASFSPDGSLIVVAGAYDTTIFDLKGSKVFEAPPAASAAMDATGDRLAIGGGDGRIEIHSRSAGRQLVLTGYNTRVSYVEFSPDGSRLLSHGDDGVTLVWDLTRKTIVGSRKIGPIYHAMMRFAPDGQGIVLSDGPRVWYPDRKDVRFFDTFEVADADVSPDGRLLVYGGSTSGLRVVDMSGAEQGDMSGHSERVWTTRFSSAGVLLTTSSDKTARLWNAGKFVELSGSNAEIWNGDFSPSGDLAVTSSSDGSTKLWNVNGKLVADLKPTDFPIGRSLAEINEDEKFASYKAPKSWHRATFRGDGKEIVTISGDNAFRIWSLEGRHIRTVKLPARAWDAQFSPDGGFIAAALGDGSVKLFGIDGGEIRSFVGNDTAFQKVKISEKGDVIFASNWVGAFAWSIAGERLVRIPTGTGGSMDADMNDDGTVIVTANGPLRGFDIHGNLLFSLGENVEQARFLPNGSILATSMSQTMLVAKPPLGQELVDRARQKTSRCLTSIERAEAGLPPGSQECEISDLPDEVPTAAELSIAQFEGKPTFEDVSSQPSPAARVENAAGSFEPPAKTKFKCPVNGGWQLRDGYFLGCIFDDTKK
ncbi:toll/interleukin-1 receptor domain-containing protein [Agrobacterium pusense]|uniref:toll/interleukin-1 receptor domain-containing protein n=1 Tax=Agrobacterium pusense TaxID=648995 RepID=UPI003D13EDDF